MMDNKLTNKPAALSPLQLKPLRCTGLLVLCLLTLGFGPHVVADSARGFGSGGASNHPAGQHSGNAPARLSSYYSALQNYEAEGPYHQNASEVLYGLGLELQKHGQHNKALKALRRAMHINRVNSGLNSLSQAPMLRSIINSQKSLVHIEPTTKSYHQLLRLHTATYGKQDPRIAPLLNELGLWHIDAYQFDESKARVDHLTSAYSLIASALQLNEMTPNDDPNQQIHLLRSAALVSFFLSRHEGDAWSSSTDSHYSLSADGFATTRPQRTAILSGTSFRRGRVCHERIVALTAANPNASLKDKIQAQTELADWYLLFNHRKEAMHRYQQVLAQIAASDQAETLHAQIFATPSLLPAMRMENHQSQNGGLFMTADVDISNKGWGSHIKNIENTLSPRHGQANHKSLHYKLVETIKRARFRPQFVDNNPADVSNVSIIIPLIH